MRVQTRFTLAATVVILTTLAATPAQAQIRRATVEVQGLACPFCAYGLEKLLRDVGGTGEVDVELKVGRAVLEAESGSSLDLQAITGAVRKAGFTPGLLEATAEGTVRFEPDADGSGAYVLETLDGDPLLLLVNLSAEQNERVQASSDRRESIVATGEVHFHADALPGLEPASIESVD